MKVQSAAAPHRRPNPSRNPNRSRNAAADAAPRAAAAGGTGARRKQPDIALEREKKRKEELKRKEEELEEAKLEPSALKKEKADDKQAKLDAKKLAEKKEAEKKLKKKKRKGQEKSRRRGQGQAEKADKAAKDKACAPRNEAHDRPAPAGRTGTAAKSTAPRIDGGYIAGIARQDQEQYGLWPGDDTAAIRNVFPGRAIADRRDLSVRKVKEQRLGGLRRAVERGINKSSPLPKKKDGTVERSLPVRLQT
jgi:colicin import membrane protein